MKIAFLGLGAMGLRMAQRLLNPEHELFVYNRTKERATSLLEAGAKWANSPREAAETAEVVICMVTDNEASQNIWLDETAGAIHGLKPDSIAIDSSTLTPEYTKTLAAEIERTGAKFIDAPVVGSRPQVEAGQLIYLLGGDPEVIERAKPIFSAIGGKSFHTGGIGTATLFKLAVNSFYAIQAAALSEILVSMKNSGVEPANALEVLNQLPVMSAVAQRIGGFIAQQNFSPNFPIYLVEKDLRYAIENAAKHNADSPVTQAVHTIFETAKQEHADLDISGVYKFFDQNAR